MKISIIYHSVTNNTKQIGELIAKGAQKNKNVEVKLMSIDEVDEKFVNESKCVIFGSPTYYGTFSWQMKKWFDTSGIKLANKLGAVYATENFLGGGADIAELTLIGHMLVKGMIVYSGGASCGKPYTHYGAVSIKSGNEFERERAEVFGERVAKKALELFKD